MRTLVFSAIVLPLASTSVGGVVIDASYPGGNGRLVSVDAEQRVVKVATDPKGGKDYYWFNFEVSGLTLGVWRFKGLRLTAAGPAVSEDHGKTWRFLSPKGDAAWDEFVYEVKQGPGPVRFALSIPYQLSDWKLLMSSLPASPRLHAGTLCSDRSGRNVPLLEVFPEEKRAKMTLLFTARHHCCEASASHVLEGIVREVFSGSEEGRWVADNARVVVVPFMDLDGVENGEQGKHRLPHDHNRDYVKEVYPTVRALKNLVSEKYADVPVYFVDLHAPDLRGREHDHFYTLGPRGKVQVGRWDAFRCELEAATRTAALRHDPKWDIPYGAPWNGDKAHFAEQQGLLSSQRYFERLSNAYVSFCMEFGYGLCGGVFSHEAAVELGGNVLKAQVSSIRRSVEFDPIRSAVVETQAVRSAAMGRDIPVSIVLPGRCGRVRESWYDAVEWGADPTGVKDSTVALQRAIDQAASVGGGTVYIGPGRYQVASIAVGQNVRLQLAGGASRAKDGWSEAVASRAMDPKESAIIVSNGHSQNSIFLYNLVPPSYITNGCGGITVSGGTFDCRDRMKVLAFACGRNVRIENVIVKDLPNNHAFQIDGCNDVVITNCLFAGYAFPEKNGVLTRETIQIEPTSPRAITGRSHGYSPIVCRADDSRPNGDIVVKGCWFGPSERRGSHLIALGHHGVPRSCNGLVFADNVVVNPLYCGVRIANVSDAVIEGNVFVSERKSSCLKNDSAAITIWGPARLSPGERGVTLRNNCYLLSQSSPLAKLWVSPARKDEVVVLDD